MKKQTPHKPLPKSVKWLWGIVFAPFALLLLLLLLTAAGLFGRLPSFEELENPKSNLATEILSSDGKVLGTFFVQNRSLRTVRRTLPARLRPAAPARRIRRAADHRGPDFDGGCPLPGTLGHRLDVAGTRRRQDRPDAEHLAGRRQYDHPAISQKPLSPRHQREPGQDRPHDQVGRIQTQGVDHGPETRIQLHQGGDRRHVPEYRGVRFERLRHQIGGPHLLQQGTPRTQHPGSRPAGGTGQGPHDVFPRRNPENALARRNLVLDRMASAGAITRYQRDSIAALPILLNYKPVSHNEGPATYFREMLRRR